jgi:hypothetical protein
MRISLSGLNWHPLANRSYSGREPDKIICVLNRHQAEALSTNEGERTAPARPRMMTDCARWEFHLLEALSESTDTAFRSRRHRDSRPAVAFKFGNAPLSLTALARDLLDAAAARVGGV